MYTYKIEFDAKNYKEVRETVNPLWERLALPTLKNVATKRYLAYTGIDCSKPGFIIFTISNRSNDKCEHDLFSLKGKGLINEIFKFKGTKMEPEKFIYRA